MKIDDRKSISDNLAAFGYTHQKAEYKPYCIPYGSRAIYKGDKFIGYYTAQGAMDMLRRVVG